MSNLALASGGNGGGDDGEGKPSKGALAALNKLKAAAGRGDKNAIKELQKLRTMVQQAAATKSRMIEALEAPEVEDEEPDVIGADELFGLDELDRADHIMRRMATADSLSHGAALLHGQEVVQQHVADWVRINPVSVNRGSRGNIVTVLRGGPVLSVASWQGEDAETLPMTVTLFYYPLSDKPISALAFRPFGKIQFGSKGITTTVEVDIAFGTQFTLSGNSITIQVGLEDGPGGASFNSIALGGTVSFYPIVRTAPTTRTKYADNIPAGGTAVFDVPNFAKSVNFYRSVDAFMDITFFGDLPIYSIVNYPPGADSAVRKFPLTGDMTSISVTNTLGVIQSVRAVFDLGI